MTGIDPKVLADYVATANNPEYKGDYDIINSKFPELKDYDSKLLADYVATANNPEYGGDYATINSKFPEFFQDAPQQTGLKKNTEETQMQTQGEEVPPQSNTKRPNYVGDFFSQFGSVDDIANYANVVDKKKTPADKYDLVGKSRSDISKLAQAEAMLEEKKAPLNKGFQRSNDIQREKLQKENDEKGTISNSYGKRTDGTEKGKGYFGEIPILSGDEKGKIATEKSISIEVDGKEILIPTIVPTLSSDEISFIQSGGNVLESPEIEEKAIAHAFKRMDEGKSPFATAEDRQIKTTTLDEDGKLKEVITDLDASPYIEQKTVKDLDPISIIQKIDPDDIKAATGQPNTYEVGTDEFYSYGQKQLNAKQFNTKVDEWNKSTGLGVEEYLNWQTKEQEVYGDMLSKYNESMSNTEWDTDPNVRREQSQTEWDMSLSKYDSERNAKWDAFIKEYEQKQADKTSLRGQNKEDYLKRLNYLVDYVLTNTITGKGSSFLMGAGAYLWDTWKYGEGDDRVRRLGEVYRSIQQQATDEMSQYAPDNMLMEGSLMTIGLGIDSWSFNVLKGISGGINNVGWNVFSKTLNRMGVAEPMAKLSTLKYLQKLSPAINKIPTIAQSATESAGLLAMYDGITDFTDKLKTKKVSELTRDDLLESFHATGRGYAGGLAIGTLGGVSNNVLQRVNSKAIQSMYPTFSMEARKIGAAKLPLKYRAIATGTFVGTGLFEFGVVFPASHATYDYVVGGDKEAFKHITWESALEEGIKGFLAIKMQHMPNLKATTKDVEWKGKFNSEIKYGTYELRSLGVKDYMELKQKVESPEFRKSAMESDKVPVSTKNKLIYDNTGYMNKATVPIDKTSIEIIDNEICLVSSTKDNVLVDVTPMESMSQAKLLEGISANLNLVDGVVRKASELDYEGSNNINAFYEKSPEKLMALNDALAKEMKDKTTSDYQVIKEADMLLDKEIEAMAKRTEPIKDKVTKEAPVTEVKTEPKVEVDIKQTETTTKEGEFKVVEVEGKEYQVKLKEDGTHEIKTTNDAGLEIPLRTAEGKNLETSKKVIEKFEGKVKPKTDVEVKEQVTEQPKTETKEPVKEYAAKVEETAEVKSEKVIFSIRDIVQAEKRATKSTEKKVREDFNNFIKEIQADLKVETGEKTPKGKPRKTGIGKYLDNRDYNNLLTQIRKAESTSKKESKQYKNAVEEISNLVDKAVTGMMKEGFVNSEKFAEKVMTTERFDKQTKTRNAKVDPDRIEFVEKVKNKGKQDIKTLEEKVEKLKEDIINETDPVKLEALKEDLKVSLYAWDLSKMNTYKQEFESATNMTDKKFAYEDYMDAFKKFQSKDPMGDYKASVEKRLEIIEAERKPAREARENIINRVKFTDEQYSVQESFVETIGKVKSGEYTERVDYLTKLKISIINNDNLSPKRKQKLLDNIEKLEDSKFTTATKDIATLEKLLKVEDMAVESENRKAGHNMNVIQKATIQTENLKGILEIIGARNSVVKEIGKKLVDKADQSAIKFDKLEIDKIITMQDLELMINESKDIRINWSKDSKNLGLDSTVKDWRELSYSEIVNLYKSFKNKGFADVLKKNRPEDAVDALEKHVIDIVEKNPDLIKISDKIDSIHDKIYDILNEQYKKEKGVDLTKLDYYTALVGITSTPRVEVDAKGSLAPNAIKERVGARDYKTKINILDVLENSYSQAIKYNAFSDVNRYWRNTLENKDVKNAIKTLPNGNTLNKALETLYKNYPEGVKINETRLPQIVNKLAVSKLMANLTLTPKQISSLFNVYVDYAKKYSEMGGNQAMAEIAYMRDFISSKETRGEFVKAWGENGAIKNRLNQGNIDPSMKAAYESDLFTLMNKDYPKMQDFINSYRKFNRKFKEIQMIPVKGGDIGALVGAKPLFSLYLKEAKSNGLSGKEARTYAMDRTYATFAKSNQSVWAHNMSPFQYSGIGKAFGYWSSPIQMGQQYRSAARTLVNPSSTPKERAAAGKGVIYYGAVQQAIFILAGTASTGMIKYIFKKVGEQFGYSTNPESAFDDLKDFLSLPENVREAIGVVMENQGATQGIPGITTIVKNIAKTLKKDKYPAESLINKVEQIEDLQADVFKTADAMEKIGWNPLKINELSEAERRMIRRTMAGLGDASSGWGVSTTNRYYEWFTGKDIYNAAKKDSNTDSSKGRSGSKDSNTSGSKGKNTP